MGHLQNNSTGHSWEIIIEEIQDKGSLIKSPCGKSINHDGCEDRLKKMNHSVNTWS